MAFAIRSTNENLPALVFGDFKVDIRQWKIEHPEYDNATGYPIEDIVGSLGTDIVGTFGGDGGLEINVDYPSQIRI